MSAPVSWMRRSWRAAAVLATATVSVWLAAAPPPTLAAPAKLRLYVLDCGTIAAMDPTLFGVKPEELGHEATFVTPCYLIVHPKGTLIWDVGQVPDQDIPDDGTEVVVQGLLKAKRRLSTQLAALGYQPKDITFLAMSHYHVDHTANANSFAASTWIVHQAEYDAMFSDAKRDIRSPETYSELKGAKRITLNNEDHDVRRRHGDHKDRSGAHAGTPGAVSKLARFGPLLLAGDLYHLPEERTLDRVPTFDFDAAMTRQTRRKVDEFLHQSGATMWIQHDPATYARLKKAPQYYD
jgi:glyoxylase-like metal-dependent hydrolase (beta-lactamase superfamily II)